MTVSLRVPRPSVRARLTLACTAVAAVVGVAGVALFTVLLHRGVDASLDTVLRARAERVVSAFGAAGPTPSTAEQPPGPADEFDSFTAVYRPDGTLAEVDPATAARRLLDADQVRDARRGISHIVLTNGEEPIRVLAEPVIRTDGTWVVAVGTSVVPVSGAADRAVRDLYVALPVLLVFVALGAWILAGSALRPVERMRADAERLGDSDTGGRITEPGSAEELARLARTFNSLLDRLHRSLIRQRELVADTGHELRTPLTVLRTELELADSPERTRADLADSIAHAHREVVRLSKLAEDFLFLARTDSAAPLVHLAPMDLRPVMVEAARAHRAAADAARVELIVDCEERLGVHGDAGALRRALDNLVANSLSAVPPGGRVLIRAHADGPEVVLEVDDDGPGFPPDYLPHAFERFSRPERSRPSRLGGTGLGLAIVAAVADAHGGRAVAANREPAGAVVSMVLRRAGRGEVAGPAVAAPAGGTG